MRRLGLALATSFALWAAACGDDEEPVSTPRPPPELALASVSSVGGPVWTPESADNCVELGSDPAGTVFVDVTRANFDLRPPGACGSLRPCGTVVLLIDGTEVAQSATTTLNVALGAPDAAVGTGQHTFRVELRDHLGDVVLDADQKVIASEAALEVRPPGGCAGTADAGSDAATDGPADAEADAPSDSASDAEPDAPSDAGEDASSDAASSDAASDASTD